MRSVKQDNGQVSAVPATHPSRSTNLRRRGFLLTLGVGGAGAAAVAVRSLSAGSVAAEPAVSASDDGSYAATAHVKTYYRTAKV
jgi:hypothetical protein